MRSWTDRRRMDGEAEGRSVLRPSRCFWRGGAVLVYVAAAGGAQAGVAQANAPSDGRVITDETITRSHANTAWDAVRLTEPNVQLREVPRQPARTQRHERASHDPEKHAQVRRGHPP